MRQKAILALLVLFVCLPLAAQELTIAAASDLTFVMQELGARFEKETGSKLKVTFGSSGNFFAQIQHGAPFDLFLSADLDYPQKLARAGKADPATLYEYAWGRLVLWTPARSTLDVKRGLKLLLDPAVTKIAIANPLHAPYGRAAVAAMQHEGLYDAASPKLVKGENISQAAQFVQTGNADVGLIALSLAVAPAMQRAGRYQEIPADDHPPIVQACVVVTSSPRKELARRFVEFLKRPEQVELMKKYGFVPPKP